MAFCCSVRGYCNETCCIDVCLHSCVALNFSLRFSLFSSLSVYILDTCKHRGRAFKTTNMRGGIKGGGAGNANLALHNDLISSSGDPEGLKANLCLHLGCCLTAAASLCAAVTSCTCVFVSANRKEQQTRRAFRRSWTALSVCR